MYSPLWKITHQSPSVLCTPPFEKSPITTHQFCVLPPLKNQSSFTKSVHVDLPFGGPRRVMRSVTDFKRSSFSVIDNTSEKFSRIVSKMRTWISDWVLQVAANLTSTWACNSGQPWVDAGVSARVRLYEPRDLTCEKFVKKTDTHTVALKLLSRS